MNPLFGYLDANLSPHLGAYRDGTTLDVGCGEGNVLAFLIAKGFTDVSGVDVDERAVERARHVTPRVERIEDLAQYLEGRRAELDLVIAKDVIYYFPRALLIPYLESIRRALRPTGKLVVEIFNGASFAGPLVKYKDYKIEWIFTEHSLAAVLTDAGFVVEQIVAAKIPGRRLRSLVFRGLQACWQACLRTLYFVERGRDPQNPRLLAKKLIAVARPASFRP